MPLLLNGRRIPTVLLAAVAALLTACSSTNQETLPNSDLVLRSGPTVIGWVLVYVGAVVGTLFLGFFAIAAVAVVGGESVEAGGAKKYWQAVGWALAVPMVLGLVGLGEWGIAANTVLHYQSAVVTLSGQNKELRVERDRPIGSDSVLVWTYGELASVEFDYVPGSGGENPVPPQGNVYVRATGQDRVLVFDGSPCAARELAESVTSSTGVALTVHSGGRDISGFGAFYTQLRCGIDEPIQATSWTDYPAEIWRVLDLPFLWRWPWALPIVAAQVALIAGALTVVSRLRDGTSKRRFIAMLAACAAAGAGIVAMHVFAAKSYGNWPAALALFALVSGKFVAKRLFGGVESTDLSEAPRT